MTNARSQGKKRVLVVDDDKALCQMMVTALNSAGYETRPAYDGAEALAVFKAWPPDLILLDFAMPGINGYEVAVEIRRLEGADRHTLIVFVTAYSQTTLVALDFNISTDGYITKPVLPSELIQHVREVLGA